MDNSIRSKNLEVIQDRKSSNGYFKDSIAEDAEFTTRRPSLSKVLKSVPRVPPPPSTRPKSASSTNVKPQRDSTPHTLHEYQSVTTTPPSQRLNTASASSGTSSSKNIFLWWLSMDHKLEYVLRILHTWHYLRFQYELNSKVLIN